MHYNGRLLARARDALGEIRKKNEQTLLERRAEVFNRLPEIREIEINLTKLIIGVSRAALSKGSDIESEMISSEKRSAELEARRAALLREAGYPTDYIDEICSCVHCGDSGYIGQKVCGCLKKLYDKEMARYLSSLPGAGSQSFSHLDLSLYDKTPDPLTGASARECMETIISVCKKYSEKFGKNSDNLLLQGGAGLGKTFLAVAIAQQVAAMGFSVVYETAAEAVSNLEIQRFHRGSELSDAVEAQIGRYSDCDLLILDDLGEEMRGGFSVSAIFSLLNTRLISGGKMIICTALSHNELMSRYSPQTVSRLEGEFLNLSFIGRDLRAVKKARGLE